MGEPAELTSLLEILLTSITGFGIVGHALGLSTAWRDRRTLLESAAAGSHVRQAEGDALREALRLLIQLGFCSAGIIAMSEPNPPTTYSRYTALVIAVILGTGLMLVLTFVEYVMRQRRIHLVLRQAATHEQLEYLRQRGWLHGEDETYVDHRY